MIAKKLELTSNIDWDVRVEGTVNSKRVRVVRDDNGVELAVRSAIYKPLTNSQLKELANEIANVLKTKVHGYNEVRNGSLMMAYVKADDLIISKLDGKAETYISLINSFDATKKLTVAITIKLCRTESIFSVLMDPPALRSKHTKGNVFDAKKLAAALVEQYRVDLANFVEKILTDWQKPITEEYFQDFLLELLNLKGRVVWPKQSEDKFNQLITYYRQDSFLLGENRWALFNALIYYTTHKAYCKETCFANLLSTVGILNERGLELLEK